MIYYIICSKALAKVTYTSQMYKSITSRALVVDAKNLTDFLLDLYVSDSLITLSGCQIAQFHHLCYFSLSPLDFSAQLRLRNEGQGAAITTMSAQAEQNSQSRRKAEPLTH